MKKLLIILVAGIFTFSAAIALEANNGFQDNSEYFQNLKIDPDSSWDNRYKGNSYNGFDFTSSQVSLAVCIRLPGNSYDHRRDKYGHDFNRCAWSGNDRHNSGDYYYSVPINSDFLKTYQVAHNEDNLDRFFYQYEYSVDGHGITKLAVGYFDLADNGNGSFILQSSGHTEHADCSYNFFTNPINEQCADHTYDHKVNLANEDKVIRHLQSLPGEEFEASGGLNFTTKKDHSDTQDRVSDVENDVNDLNGIKVADHHSGGYHTLGTFDTSTNGDALVTQNYLDYLERYTNQIDNTQVTFTRRDGTTGTTDILTLTENQPVDVAGLAAKSYVDAQTVATIANITQIIMDNNMDIFDINGDGVIDDIPQIDGGDGWVDSDNDGDIDIDDILHDTNSEILGNANLIEALEARVDINNLDIEVNSIRIDNIELESTFNDTIEIDDEGNTEALKIAKTQIAINDAQIALNLLKYDTNGDGDLTDETNVPERVILSHRMLELDNIDLIESINNSLVKTSIKDQVITNNTSILNNAENINSNNSDSLNRDNIIMNNVISNRSDINKNRVDIDSLFNQVDDLRNDLCEGLASAQAQSAANGIDIESGKDGALIAGLGHSCDGQASLALGVKYQINEDTQIVVSVSIDEEGDYTGSSIGVGWSF